jgi:hypothetical protein
MILVSDPVSLHLEAPESAALPSLSAASVHLFGDSSPMNLFNPAAPLDGLELRGVAALCLEEGVHFFHPLTHVFDPLSDEFLMAIDLLFFNFDLGLFLQIVQRFTISCLKMCFRAALALFHY